jgi:hypothetical protein
MRRVIGSGTEMVPDYRATHILLGALGTATSDRDDDINSEEQRWPDRTFLQRRGDAPDPAYLPPGT